jgi:acyl carrier protein
MHLDDIYAQLTDVLRDVFDDDTLKAVPEMTADDVDGWDSFAHLRVMAAVESAFHVDFAASQITGMKNVGELASLVQSKLAKQA